MEAGRRALPHETPLWVDVSRSVYFITCCVQDRGDKPFFRPETARGLLDSIMHRIEKGEWWVYAATVMPDHVHLVLTQVSHGCPETRIKPQGSFQRHYNLFMLGFRFF